MNSLFKKYQQAVSHFNECSPLTVKEYFRDNWELLYKPWAWIMETKFTTGNFLNSTSNRLSIKNDSQLFITGKGLLVTLRVLRSEQDHKVVPMTVQNVPVVLYTTLTEGAVTYMKFLTTYGYQFVAKQSIK